MPQERKRRKVSLLGTYAQFKQAQEESKQEEPADEEFKQPAHSEQRPTPTGSSHVPNIIGNVEDGEYPQVATGQQVAFGSVHGNAHEPQPVSEPENFTDITGNLKRSRRRKSKSPF